MESMVSVIYLIPNPEVKIKTIDKIQAIIFVNIFLALTHNSTLKKQTHKKATQSGTKILNGKISI